MSSQSTTQNPGRSDVPIVVSCDLIGKTMLFLEGTAWTFGRNANFSARKRTTGGDLGQKAVKMGFHPTHGVLLV
jgi:hypothetical protein